MYAVFMESRIRVSDENRAVLSQTEEGRKHLTRAAEWGRDKHPRLTVYGKEAADQIAALITADRVDTHTEFRAVVEEVS